MNSHSPNGSVGIGMQEKSPSAYDSLLTYPHYSRLLTSWLDLTTHLPLENPTKRQVKQTSEPSHQFRSTCNTPLIVDTISINEIPLGTSLGSVA